jgi:diguanylate cyclase (GGDEF)-like protein/PAS domain S-box-containing protein
MQIVEVEKDIASEIASNLFGAVVTPDRRGLTDNRRRFDRRIPPKTSADSLRARIRRELIKLEPHCMRAKGRSFSRNPEIGPNSPRKTPEANQDPSASPKHVRSESLQPNGARSFTPSPAAIFITDAEGRIRGCSPQATALFGYQQVQLLSIPIEELIPESFPRLRWSNREGQSQRVRSIEPAFDLIGKRKDGTKFPIELKSTSMETDTGSAVLIIARDATERVVAPADRRQNNQQFRSVVEAVLDYAIYLLDSDGHVKTWNAGAARIKGFTPDEVLGQHFSRFFTQEDTDHGKPARLLHQAAVHGRMEDEGWRVRKDGSRFWAHSTVTAIRGPGGETTSFVKVTRDITDRKLAQDALVSQYSDELHATSEALKASDARYRAVFHTSPEAVTISRANDGIILDANQAFFDITGYERQEVIGKTTTQLRMWAVPRDRFRLVEILRRDSSCRDMELQFRRKNNEIFWARVSVSFMEVDGARCMLSFARDISEAKMAEEKIKDLAFYDPLTGLANRRLLLERVLSTVVARTRNDRKRALLFIDLDDFKTLNDTLGHHIGDLLLQHVARRITSCIRKNDTVGRFGGDEFVVMLEDLSDISENAAAQAREVADKIRIAIAHPYVLENHECSSASSIGITVFGDDAKSMNEVLQQADIAMYQAKATGRNTIHFFAPALQAAVNARAAAEDDLRRAITTRQFLLYFQSQMDDGRLTGAEALLRWNHPRRGIVFPGEFIPLAEETGLILSLGDWALESACKQVASWAHNTKMEHLTVSVNISFRQMRHPSFVEQVLATLERTGADPRKLRLELTESMFVDSFEEIVAKMEVLKARGFRFSVDDFGTGFSCLSYLKRLPIDELKIDRTFVHDIVTDVNSGAIAESIILLGRALGLSVIAEGVETEQQRDSLLRLGCSSFQGWLFGKAVPAGEFQSMC